MSVHKKHDEDNLVMAVDDGGAGHEDEVDDARPQPGLSVEPDPGPGE